MSEQARDFGAEYQAGRFVPDYHGLGYCVMRKGSEAARMNLTRRVPAPIAIGVIALEVLAILVRSI